MLCPNCRKAQMVITANGSYHCSQCNAQVGPGGAGKIPVLTKMWVDEVFAPFHKSLLRVIADIESRLDALEESNEKDPNGSDEKGSGVRGEGGVGSDVESAPVGDSNDESPGGDPVGVEA